MKQYKGLSESLNIQEECIVTIGKFQTLHLGHQALLKKANEVREKTQSLVVIRIVGTNETDFLNRKHYISILKEYKIDYFVELTLDDIRMMDALDFLEGVLINQFHMKKMIVGEDFMFGFQKKGDCAFLQKYEPVYNYKTIIIKDKMLNNRKISSSAIFEAQRDGDYEQIEAMMGEKFGEN